MNDEAKISQRYRELEAQEPPRALDDAILAAARRKAGARPGFPGRAAPRRWYAPLAATAVLVLAVAVTLNMQREQPGNEFAPPQAVSPPDADKKAVKETANEIVIPAVVEEVKIPRRKSAEQPVPAVAAAPTIPAAPEPKPFAADQAAASPSVRADESRGAASSVTGTLARQAEERTSRDAAARVPQPGPVQALAKRAERAEAQAAPQAQKEADTPERELERIAGLRAQGRHDEADSALADFRKRYPDYRIPDPMRERVERR